MPPNPAITPAAVAAGAINNPQRRVLHALAQARGPMTQRLLRTTAFRAVQTLNMAPIIDPLVEANLVKIDKFDFDGRKETVYSLTATGRAMAAQLTALPPPSPRGEGTGHKELPPIGGTITKTYRGVTYEVAIVPGGFALDGETYGSLSAVAKVIQGHDAPVNGWAFFGLVK